MWPAAGTTTPRGPAGHRTEHRRPRRVQPLASHLLDTLGAHGPISALPDGQRLVFVEAGQPPEQLTTRNATPIAADGVVGIAFRAAGRYLGEAVLSPSCLAASAIRSS